MIVVKLNVNEPIQGFFDSYCSCNASTNTSKYKNNFITCKCGEDCNVQEWSWDDSNNSKSATVSDNKKDVLFHKTFSSGTAAVRGKEPFEPNCHYYWEIKMLTALYGTDVMVGVGTESVDMHLWPYRFCSLLGQDSESWGYSYRGSVQHAGRRREYGPRFGRGSLVGAHLDLVAGTLEFYLNRRPLGVAFTGLRGRRLYPMVSSTAAQSGVRVTCSLSAPHSLQMMAIRQLEANAIPPGLKRLLQRRFWWLLGEHHRNRKRKRDHPAAIRDHDDSDSDQEQQTSR